MLVADHHSEHGRCHKLFAFYISARRRHLVFLENWRHGILAPYRVTERWRSGDVGKTVSVPSEPVPKARSEPRLRASEPRSFSK